jgi:hypothetical protein
MTSSYIQKYHPGLVVSLFPSVVTRTFFVPALLQKIHEVRCLVYNMLPL